MSDAPLAALIQSVARGERDALKLARHLLLLQVVLMCRQARRQA